MLCNIVCVRAGGGGGGGGGKGVASILIAVLCRFKASQIDGLALGVQRMALYI